MNATNKSDAVAALVKIWENKNAQRALRGAGLSTMALSLAACGSDSADAVVDEPVVEEPVVTPVALALTTGNDIFDANDFTAVADTVTGTSATYGAADVLVDATDGDGDTLTVTATADITNTPTVVGIENIVFNGEFFAAAGAGLDVDADGIANGTITLNHTQLGSAADTSVVTNANAVTVVAGTNVDDLTVEMNEDAGTIVNAGSASAVAITSEDGDDQVATLVANGDVTVTTDDTAGTLTDLNITATAASDVTVVANAALDTITGDANTTIVAGTDIADLDAFTITGVAGVEGAGAAGPTDISGIDATVTITDGATSELEVADGQTVVVAVATAAGTVTVTPIGDLDADTNLEIAANVTLSGATTAALVYDLVAEVDNTDASDEISTLNVTFGAAMTANAGDDVTISVVNSTVDVAVNLSGAAAQVAFVDGAGDLTVNAAAMTGALTAVIDQANIASVTGGAGDDDITLDNLTNAALVVAGGAGDDTLTADAGGSDLTGMTVSGFEIIDGDFDGLASQFHNATYVVAAGSVINIDVAETSIDIATIDLSGMTFADATDDVIVDLTAIDAAILLAGQGFNYTGSDAEDDVTGSANADTISGGAGIDTLVGGAGADIIDGGAGADEITGGTGADTLTGGAGADDFNYADGDNATITVAGADTITDFVTGSDQIDIDGFLVADVLTDVESGDGSAVANLTALIALVDASFDAGGGANNGDQIYFSYNALGSGDTYVFADTDASGSFDAGDVFIILSGLDAAADLVAADFI